MVGTWPPVLLCWFQNWLASSRRSDENLWLTVPGTRVHGAAVQNRSRSI